jgi:hypothetical protein
MSPYCCLPFEDALSQAGNRGLAIVVDISPTGAVEFILQHRAVDAGAPAPTDYAGALVLVNDARIGFCPWCGKRLATFYADRATKLARPGFRIDLPDIARS